jgi:hypothetical protein
MEMKRIQEHNEDEDNKIEEEDMVKLRIRNVRKCKCM